MSKKRVVNRRTKRANMAGFLFALPWIIGFLLFSLYPIVISMYYSLTEFNLFQSAKWVGFKNYIDLFTKDRLFGTSMINTLYMVLIGMPLSLLAGLLTAMLLNTDIRGRSVYRTLFYLPSIVPVVASSLLWIWILNPQYGLLNNCLSALGLYQPNWLSDPNWTKPSLVIIGMWGSGNVMVIFLAALQDVPRSLYEAAEIDGARAAKRFLHITLPSITPVILFQLVMGIINSFQYFTQAYIIVSSSGGLNVVSGGPRNSLLFYALYLYHNAFAYFKMGKASAMAWILFLIVAAVTAMVVKTSKKWVFYGGE